MADVTILKSALLYEAQMLSEALEDAGVPYYQQMSTFAGVRYAMPAFPVQGPGTFYSVLVPEIAADDARRILDDLPITADNNPGLWSYNPKPWAKRFWIAMAVVALAAFALEILSGLYKMLVS